MAVDRKLVEILCCPVTKVPVKLLARDRLAVLNRLIEEGSIERQDGSRVETPLEAALVTDDGLVLYPVEEDIPVMLEDQGILARQVPGW